MFQPGDGAAHGNHRMGQPGRVAQKGVQQVRSEKNNEVGHERSFQSGTHIRKTEKRGTLSKTAAFCALPHGLRQRTQQTGPVRARPPSGQAAESAVRCQPQPFFVMPEK